VQSGTARAVRPRYHEIMKLPDITIAVVLALAIICTVVAVSLLNFPGNWLLAIGGGVLPLIIILRMWHPPLRPAFARMVRK
jgi:purine-cytosine permease-like protein